MNINKKIAVGAVVIVGTAAVVAAPFMAHAATTYDSELTQTISDGTLSTDIRDAGGSVVASPSFAMTGATVSNSQQTATGTFGSNSQRITVDNPGGADDGWTLTWNATTPGTGVWSDGTYDYAYNDTPAAGRLTVDPSVATLTVNTPIMFGSTGVTLGTSEYFTGTDPITLLSADATAYAIWNGYITGVGLSQTIPASKPAGSYSIDMTQTVTAI